MGAAGQALPATAHALAVISAYNLCDYHAFFRLYETGKECFFCLSLLSFPTATAGVSHF